SFCLAPALLVYKLSILSKFVFPITAFFVCAGIFRLARFNSGTSNTSSFKGMPTTFAAFFIVNLILCSMQHEGFVFEVIQDELLFITGICGFLMISTIDFPSFKDKNPVSTTSRWRFLFLALAAFFYLGRFHGVLLVGLVTYLMYSMRGVYERSARRLKIGRSYR
ncbi:MAG: hypothetical protein ABUT20_61770, partial [Bacteroidota bacterium]